MTPEPKTKIHTLLTALDVLRKYCAYQERSQVEVRDKLYSLGMNREETEQGITTLIEEGFLNEERYAIAYAGGKFRIKKWGRIKIKMGLRQRSISEWNINNALKVINDNEYRRVLSGILEEGMKKNNSGKLYIRQAKTARLAIGRGYEPDLVWELLKLNGEEGTDI